MVLNTPFVWLVWVSHPSCVPSWFLVKINPNPGHGESRTLLHIMLTWKKNAITLNVPLFLLFPPVLYAEQDVIWHGTSIKKVNSTTAKTSMYIIQDYSLLLKT